ncbi:hypothetical protein wVul_1754 [Wolbachia endosymbiont of Armadillidium vulgare str. wVulC]|nr:hypothetical protein wVul_1754 [Wolbachia endosymbiont of Armadillidium vulgare str. wVulC]
MPPRNKLAAALSNVISSRAALLATFILAKFYCQAHSCTNILIQEDVTPVLDTGFS